MKISLDWLNQYLDAPIDADEAQRLLDAQGFPIEETFDADGDTVLDVEVTSNRSDCLSHVGAAREVAAGSGRALRQPAAAPPESDGDSAEALTSVELKAPDHCPTYTARVIRGVKVGPSPDWLVAPLEAMGLRSVNNVVDVTNFVLLELGQPLHAFDLGKLTGRRVVVRLAKKGEAFTAIDNSKHQLRDDMLVIADAEKPVAVAGVMGGLETEVGSETTDILLESAAFEPLSVRSTSRALKLSSDSSYRFERGVDPYAIERASRRAAALILELAGGTLAPGVVRAGQAEPELAQVSMRVDRCNAILGAELSEGEIGKLLGRLGLQPQVVEPGVIGCTIPSYRLDLQREVDLIEEVARLRGLDKIEVRQKMPIVTRPVQQSVVARRTLDQVLVAHGYHETVTFSFLPEKSGRPFLGKGEEAVLLADERRKAEPMLRPSVLPSLLSCRKTNQDVGNDGLALYEKASTWRWQGGKLVEVRKLALLCDVADRDAQTTLRRVRGTLDELARHLQDKPVTVEPVEDSAYAAAGRVLLDGKPIGALGLLSPKLAELFDLQSQVIAAELDLDPLLADFPPARTVTEVPRFPAIERDLSVIVDESVSWSALLEQVQRADPALLEDLQFLVTYRGKPIPAGRKSVSFRMLFRDPSKTLRHDEVDPQVKAVVDRLAKQLGAELRS